MACKLPNIYDATRRLTTFPHSSVEDEGSENQIDNPNPICASSRRETLTFSQKFLDQDREVSILVTDNASVMRLESQED